MKGGSTVIQTWENLYRNFRQDGPKKGGKVHVRKWDRGTFIGRDYRWIQSRTGFYKFFDSQYSFSYVRDPIPRFLSSFFEYIVRGNDKVEEKYMNNIESQESKNDKDPKHLVEELAKIMEHRAICEWNQGHKEDDYKPYSLSIYWDDHINPQMHFLLNDKWDWYKLNYVGYIDKMDETLYKIMIENSDLQPDDLSFDTFMNKHYEKARDRHSKQYQQMNKGNQDDRHSKIKDASKLVLEAYELNSDLIQKICDLYWMDYLCLPFDIPQQCNLTDLFLQHYGDHVVYNDCYQ